MGDSKVSVTITNRAPGIQPPLYVAGSFSDPSWVPEPMEHTEGEDGVYTFTKNIQVEPHSKIQYKFRAGEDHWFLNEGAPSVTDESGNKNNLLEAPGATEIAESTDGNAQEEQTAPSKTTDDPSSIALKITADPTPSNDHSQDHVVEGSKEAKPHGKAEEPQLFSKVDALKQSEHIHRWESSTPEIADEVADSAALLDPPTPIPEPEPTHETLPNIGREQGEDRPWPSTVASDAADTNTEATDTGGTSDAQEVEHDIQQQHKSPSLESKQEPAEVAAEVADTAAALDAEQPVIQVEAPTPGYKSLADVKADMKDESLDIAGYSDDPEPVPLFAHECAGLYEDDEIPGADDVDEQNHRINGLLGKSDEENFDDPTLEKFPSTRDEIISTVRKVETGLNADQTHNDGVPPSPVFRPRRSDSHSDHSDRELSPTSARVQQTLPLPPPLPQSSIGERSLSAASLHSIAEQAEGEEIEEPRIQDIASMVEPVKTNDETAHHDSQHHVKEEESAANKIAPLAEQAQTADESVQIAQEAEEDPIKDEDSAIERASSSIQETSVHENGQTSTQEMSTDVGDKEEVPSTTEHSRSTAEKTAPVVAAVTPPVAEELTPVTELTKSPDEDTQLSTEVDEDEKEGESKADEIAPRVEEAATADEAIQIAKDAEGEAHLSPPKQKIEPIVTVPSPSTEPTTGMLSPVSDEDEAVVLKNGKGKDTETSAELRQSGYLTPERAASPQPEEPSSPREPPPDVAAPITDHGNDEDAPDTAALASKSPQIVVSEAGDDQPAEQLLRDAALAEDALNSNAASVNDAKDNTEDHVASRDQCPSQSVDAPKDDIETPSNNNTHPKSSDDSPAATSSAVEDSQAGTLKKRSVAQPNPRDRSTTPNSIPEAHRDAAKNGNWFTAFFRLIFIDFVGGFVSRLCGRRRKATLVTTVVAVTAVGIMWYRKENGAIVG